MRKKNSFIQLPPEVELGIAKFIYALGAPRYLRGPYRELKEVAKRINTRILLYNEQTESAKEIREIVDTHFSYRSWKEATKKRRKII
jgi:hypothetical protein